MLLDVKSQKYKLLVEKLFAKCQDVQTENERCVLRINLVKKLLRRRVRDVEILKRRLDKHNDNWRSLPMVAPHPKRKIEQKRGPKPKPKNPNEEPKEKKQRKQRAKKGDVVAQSAQSAQQQQQRPTVVVVENLPEPQAKPLLLVQQQNAQIPQNKCM